MVRALQMEEVSPVEIAQETPPKDAFIAPSINDDAILNGHSYTHHSEIPRRIADNKSTEVVLGIDEAGRGPVLGQCILPSNVREIEV